MARRKKEPASGQIPGTEAETTVEGRTLRLECKGVITPKPIASGQSSGEASTKMALRLRLDVEPADLDSLPYSDAEIRRAAEAALLPEQGKRRHDGRDDVTWKPSDLTIRSGDREDGWESVDLLPWIGWHHAKGEIRYIEVEARPLCTEAQCGWLCTLIDTEVEVVFGERKQQALDFDGAPAPL